MAALLFKLGGAPQEAPFRRVPTEPPNPAVADRLFESMIRLVKANPCELAILLVRSHQRGHKSARLRLQLKVLWGLRSQA
jgi:hypothetical protein